MGVLEDGCRLVPTGPKALLLRERIEALTA
jgi:hypothetical protein